MFPNRNIVNVAANRRVAILVTISVLAVGLALAVEPLGFQTWFSANTSGWPTTIVTFFQFFVPALALIAYGYMYFRTVQSGGAITHEMLVSAAIIIPVSIFIGGLLIPLGVLHLPAVIAVLFG